MLLAPGAFTALLATLIANPVSARSENHLHEPRRVTTTQHHTTSTAIATASASTAFPTINLGYSTVRAVAGNSSIGYYKYQNIRFAQAPLGDLRFAKPQWPLDETTINTGSLASQSVDCSSEEDCLFMDVWVPANASASKTSLPVMVWTYGGGFTGGGKSENTPEGLFDLSLDFIFVSFNYRLGFTGITPGVTLPHEGGFNNVGLYDVEHAYRWVHKHIAKFGGNPQDVTAFGFSAGASMPLFQITRFGGHNEQLFNKAYLTSPGFVPGAGHHHGEQFFQNVSTAVGCDGGQLECMRSTAGSDVADEWTYQFQPRVDGDFVTDTYESNLYQRRFNFTGPMVISHEQHEANSSPWSGVDSAADIPTTLRTFFPSITDDVIDELLALYPEDDFTSAGLRFSSMKQDLDLTAHNFALTEALGNNTWGAEVKLSPATHGTDQSYYSRSPCVLSPSSGPAMARAKADPSSSIYQISMQKYLISFVLTGNPNKLWSNDHLYWPKYGSEAQIMVFNETSSIGTDDLANARSLYWNKALWW
ncbi:Alpha/Beta hydrolase protein [Leucosporidium creatinivorum]|uniref:Alpha/Beta hydrolase protein n=1 Tax=Leucosporidium creatinivorum TaxID=106004 RepID=A0A1Y2FZA6_9BASI|nr:Alpha/Beta hydrolase protein [Leucosporidium creatinivorum]